MVPQPVTILIVEDEGAMRDLVIQMLAEKGFRTLAAADGYEALRLIGEQNIDLLLTDVVMPGISGFQLATRARQIQPDLKVLYMTGYAGEAAGREDGRLGKLLAKPLRPAELVWHIQQALGVES